MAIKGVNPSYFAGMPTVELDPKAGKPDPQYARMLSDAMQNRAAQTARRRESDEANAFKARDLDQQGRRDRMSNDISKRNAAVNEAGEKRLQGGQEFEQKRLALADTRDLIHALQNAKQAKDQAAVEFFTDELNRRGYGDKWMQESDEDFAKRMPGNEPPGPPPAARSAPVDRSPMPPRSPPPTASFPPAGEAEATPPMRGAPAGVAPRSTASFPPANGAPPPGPAPAPRPAPPAPAAPPGSGWPQPPPTDDSAFFKAPFDKRGLEGGLDNVSRALAAHAPAPPAPDRSVYGGSNAQFEEDMGWHPPTEKELLDRAIANVVAREAAGQTPTARPLLPGKTLRRRAAESDQLVSPDDPLLRAQ